MNNNFNDYDIVSFEGINYMIRCFSNPITGKVTYFLYTLDGKLFKMDVPLSSLSFVSSYNDYMNSLNNSSSYSDNSTSAYSSNRSYSTSSRNHKNGTLTESDAQFLSTKIGSISNTENVINVSDEIIKDAKDVVKNNNLSLNTWNDVKNANGFATDASIVFLNDMAKQLDVLETNLENNKSAATLLHKLNITLKELLVKYAEKKEREKERETIQEKYNNEPEQISNGKDANGNDIMVHNSKKDELKKELDDINAKIEIIDNEISELQNDIDYKYKNITQKFGDLINFSNMFGNYTIFGTDGTRRNISTSDVDFVDSYDFEYMEYKGMRYWLYLPKGVENAENLPVHVYMHGLGDMSREISGGGISGQLKRHSFAFKPNAIIICPQLDSNTGWIDKGGPGKLKDVIDGVVDTYNADENRISISGYSIGAKDAMLMANTYPNYFSAVVPVSEANVHAIDAPGLEKTRYWGFAGSNDKYLKNLEYCQENSDLDFDITVLQGEGHDGVEDYVFTKKYEKDGEMQYPIIWALSQIKNS